ncbi:MAG: phosphatidate cytidylyltransferase [Burkholderiales bacterium]|nr:MAG: phosphatidate cytidylyltransferase [Burkholderiales bacterium]
MLRQRVITAVVLVAALLAAAAAGRIALDSVLAVILGAAAFEWLRLAQQAGAVCVVVAAGLAAALLAAQAFGAAMPDEAMLALMAVACGVWLLVALLVLRGAHRGARVPHATSAVLAVILLAAAWLALMRLIDAGLVYLLSVFVLVWLADIAAFFVGRRWGRRRVAPAISPGKTWAGVGGAIAAVLAVAFVTARLAPQVPAFSTLLQQRLALPLALGVLVALVALSIVGDLFESVLKRQVNAKDSGRLLPGHGGVLDRIDAMIAVLPAAALLDLWLRR